MEFGIRTARPVVTDNAEIFFSSGLFRIPSRTKGKAMCQSNFAKLNCSMKSFYVVV